MLVDGWIWIDDDEIDDFDFCLDPDDIFVPENTWLSDPD